MLEVIATVLLLGGNELYQRERKKTCLNETVTNDIIT